MAQDNVEVSGLLRLPLGGINGYRDVRGKQGRKKDKFQGCTPNKTRRTSLFSTPREAAVALAQLKQQQPTALGETIRTLDFATPQLHAAPEAQQKLPSASAAFLPRLPEVAREPTGVPVRVTVGAPMTTSQLVLAQACGMPFVRAMPCVRDAAKYAGRLPHAML